MSVFKTKLNKRLLVIAVASAVACAASLYVGYHTDKVASAEQEEADAPRTPLPAGPRRYQ